MAMFTNRTYEVILAELLDMAPAGVDIRQGSIYYDAISSCALKLANFYVDLGCLWEMLSIATATGEYLDAKGGEYGVTRNPATPARYQYVYEGTKPAAGTRFFTAGLYFALEYIDDSLYLTAEESGEASNDIEAGTPAVPVNAVSGLTRSEFGPLLEPGAATESDDAYRKRVQEKIGGPAKNGNKRQYKAWCEEEPQVGRARILPLWAGVNTVKGVLLNPEGLPASSIVVDLIQEKIDPGGTGLGEGVANIGAYFTAVAAEPVEITVSCSVFLASGSTLDTAKDSAIATIKSYLKDLALNTPDDEKMIVRISSIGALLYALPAIVDYSNLTVNAASSNIEINDDQVAVLKEVEISESV